MAWEDHPELVHAPGDGYDPDTEHDGSGDDAMGEMAEWYLERNEAEANRDLAARIEMARRPGRRPILPMEVAMAGMAGKALGEMVADRAGAARFGSQPPIGSVLRWTAPGRYGHGVTLTYLAVRVSNGDWYSTESSRGRMGWAQLVHIIGDNPCHVATAWTEIPAPEPEPQGDDVVAAWASQFRRADLGADGRGPIGEAAAEAARAEAEGG